MSFSLSGDARTEAARILMLSYGHQHVQAAISREPPEVKQSAARHLVREELLRALLDDGVEEVEVPDVSMPEFHTASDLLRSLDLPGRIKRMIPFDEAECTGFLEANQGTVTANPEPAARIVAFHLGCALLNLSNEPRNALRSQLALLHTGPPGDASGKRSVENDGTLKLLAKLSVLATGVEGGSDLSEGELVLLRYIAKVERNKLADTVDDVFTCFLGSSEIFLQTLAEIESALSG